MSSSARNLSPTPSASFRPITNKLSEERSAIPPSLPPPSASNSTTTTTTQRTNKEKPQQTTSTQQPAITTTTTTSSKQKKRILSEYHLLVADDIREHGLRTVTVDVVSKTLRSLLLIQAYDKSVSGQTTNGDGRATIVADAMGAAVEMISCNTRENRTGLYYERGDLIEEVLALCHRPPSALETINPWSALFATKPKQATVETNLQDGTQGLRLAQQILRIINNEIEPLWKNQCTNNGELKSGRTARDTVLGLLELRVEQIEEKKTQKKSTANENSGDSSSDEGDAPENVNDAEYEGMDTGNGIAFPIAAQEKEAAKKLYKLISDPVFVFIIFGPPCKLLQDELQPLAVLVNKGEDLDETSVSRRTQRDEGKKRPNTTESEMVSAMHESNKLKERIAAEIKASQLAQEARQAARESLENIQHLIREAKEAISTLKKEQAELRSAKNNTDDPDELEDVLNGQTYEEKRNELKDLLRKAEKELQELKASELEEIASQRRSSAAATATAAAAAARAAASPVPLSSAASVPSGRLSSYSVPDGVGDEVEEVPAPVKNSSKKLKPTKRPASSAKATTTTREEDVAVTPRVTMAGRSTKIRKLDG